MNPSFFLPLPPFRRSHAHIFVCLSLTHHPHYLRTWEQARSKNTHIFVIWLLLYPCSSPYCGCQGLFMSHFQSPNSLPLGWTLMANGPTVGTHSLTNAQGNGHYCYYWKVNATFIQQIMQPVSPTGVPSSRYECVMQINFLTRESVSHYKQPLRNKILRSANTKYYYSHLFFYKINKEDLQLMYSCDFWCEFIDLVGFFGCYGLT